MAKMMMVVMMIFHRVCTEYTSLKILITYLPTLSERPHLVYSQVVAGLALMDVLLTSSIKNLYCESKIINLTI